MMVRCSSGDWKDAPSRPLVWLTLIYASYMPPPLIVWRMVAKRALVRPRGDLGTRCRPAPAAARHAPVAQRDRARQGLGRLRAGARAGAAAARRARRRRHR